MEIPKQYEVMDIAGLAKHLGYAQVTIRTYLSRSRWDKIPPPSRRFHMGPIWYLGDVEEWRQTRTEVDRRI